MPDEEAQRDTARMDFLSMIAKENTAEDSNNCEEIKGWYWNATDIVPLREIVDAMMAEREEKERGPAVNAPEPDRCPYGYGSVINSYIQRCSLSRGHGGGHEMADA